MTTILLTGSSGFIGFHTAQRLLKEGFFVIWYDNENDYYDVNLKLSRRTILEQNSNFLFYKGDIESEENLKEVFENHTIDMIINLAAQVGVRNSLLNPAAYIATNIVGFSLLIELAKTYWIPKFIYASSSSVYGKNTKQPFSIEDKVDTPLSMYAASKKADELIAHAYTECFGIATIGLRFFTVYGPYGRPDMAIPSFTEKIIKGEAISLYNHGNMKRDFTYIDDVVDAIYNATQANILHGIFNVWGNNPYNIEEVVSILEKYLNKKAIKEYLPLQKGDAIETSADINHTQQHLVWNPKTSLEDGLKNFVDRHKEFYNK